MKNFNKFYKSPKHVRPALLLVAAMLSMAACVATSTPSTSSSPQAQLMFVQSAEDLKVDAAASTFRLVKVNPQTLYFSRSAGAHGRQSQDGRLPEDVEGGTR